MTPREITLRITTLKSGQPRAYADSEYEYELEVSGMNYDEVKKYCLMFYSGNALPYETWIADRDNAGVYFAGYYTFEKIGENKYRFRVHIPFAD